MERQRVEEIFRADSILKREERMAIFRRYLAERILLLAVGLIIVLTKELFSGQYQGSCSLAAMISIVFYGGRAVEESIENESWR